MALKKNIFLTLVCIALLFWSCSICSKKVQCPGFTDDEVVGAWFPYTPDMVLKFAAKNIRPKTFTLYFVSLSGPYNVYEGSTPCSAYKDVMSVEIDTSGKAAFMIKIIQQSGSAGNERSIDMRLQGLDVRSHAFGENGFQQVETYQGQPGTLQSHSSIYLDGKQFTNVQSVTFDTSGASKPPVYKFYIAKNNGLVAYATTGTSLLWVKE